MSKLLEEILERKRKQQVESEFEHVAVRQEWISNCEKLMSRITEWLKPLEDENYLEIQLEYIPIREALIGDYAAPALQLVFLDSLILNFKPVGHFIIGSQGRVDMTSGVTQLAMLIHRGNDEWEFAKREGMYGKPRTWPFNRVTFEAFLADFLEE